MSLPALAGTQELRALQRTHTSDNAVATGLPLKMTVTVGSSSPPGVAKGSTAKRDKDALASVGRTADFWRRASGIYFAYKAAQFRLSLWPAGKAHQKAAFWEKHHAWAGTQMYALCIDLRGFYLKVSLHKLHQQEQHTSQYKGEHVNMSNTNVTWLQVGQFLGARGDFVPVPICLELSRLHDQVRSTPHSKPTR